jgi:hypothetical protein
MLYGDRGYFIAYARSRTKEALGRASRSEGRDDRAKEEHSGAPEHVGTSSAERVMPAVRAGRLRRAP